MIPDVRKYYNEHFTDAKYAALLSTLKAATGEEPAIKIAETPVFLPAALTQKLIAAGEAVVDVILRPDFKTLTKDAVPAGLDVPFENDHPHFLIIDFAITKNEQGELAPSIIELQGFPSLYAFQTLLGEEFRKQFDIPSHLKQYFNGQDKDSYFSLLREVIVGEFHPENVILLEVHPEQQKTRVDFLYTEKMLGVKTVCVTKLIQEGKHLFYADGDRKIRIHRIYNRLIFDDLHRQLGGRQHETLPVNLFHELEVEWITHPNWFYRISKYTLPWLQSHCWFLHELPVIPADLENYVLKPLFSFSGKGVLLDVTQADLDSIEDPENWILQRKVEYAPVIETPGGPAYCELRLMYLWPDNAARPLLVQNLARISKSKMMNVTQDKTHSWVGVTCAFHE
jgi:hypothetical protein